MEYSGRTTAHAHKFDNWEEKGKGIGKDCIQKCDFFDVQWSNCPVEVEAEVIRLWHDAELGNDKYFYKWDSDCEVAEEYPIIHEYLTSRGITGRCLIHWWW